MNPIGIFGGTFDPIHFGHLRLAEEMAEALCLASVRFIPAGTPPHRTRPRTDAHLRLEMVRLAIAGNPHFVLDGREVGLPRLSYTVETLTSLRAEVGPASTSGMPANASQTWPKNSCSVRTELPCSREWWLLDLTF